MTKIMYGSQTFPWQMNVEKFHGQVPHMVSVLKEAGFTGMEAEIVMLDDYYTDWQKLNGLLDREISRWQRWRSMRTGCSQRKRMRRSSGWTSRSNS